MRQPQGQEVVAQAKIKVTLKRIPSKRGQVLMTNSPDMWSVELHVTPEGSGTNSIRFTETTDYDKAKQIYDRFQRITNKCDPERISWV